MKTKRWQQIEQLFHAALERGSRERAAFLARECAGDESLRREVESLLASHDRDGRSLDAADIAADLFEEGHVDRTVGQTIGPYKILKPLGRGGMGAVFLAEDAKLARRIALKVLPAEFTRDRDRVRRFEQEARAASALNHPNIVTIYDSGDSGDVHFIAMEFIDGVTLREKLARGRLKLGEALDIASQVASALAAAHSASIVHRDIKPENIVVRRDGYVKVLDFGLAKLTVLPAADDALTKSQFQTEAGMLVGTPHYMSPEQVRGAMADTRSDIFSFGAVFYEMLSGRRPFEATTIVESMNAILNEDPPDLAPEIPPAVQRIVRRCLEKQPEKRFQSAEDLAFTLRALATDSKPGMKLAPVVTAPRTNARRIPVLRRRWLLAVAIFVTALAATLVVTRPWNRQTGSMPAAAPGRIASIAVLPLANLSGESAQEYFADGMTEALISHLSQIQALRVISRTSVMRYKGSSKSLPEIARELGVDAVVEGSVRQAGDRIKISAKLIQAAPESSLWAREYERDRSELLKLESEVARAVASGIQVRLTPGESQRLARTPQVNSEAYEAYLLGTYHRWKLDEENLKKSVEHFQRAIQLEPAYAAAHAGLATAWEERGIWGAVPFQEAQPKSRAAALRAIELDENLGAAHASLGHVLYIWDWDWKGAERELKRALELDPNEADAHVFYANLLMAMDRFPEALAEAEQARSLDPFSSTLHSHYGRILYRARRYEEAIPYLQKAIDLDSRNFGAYGRLADVYEQLGRYEEAIVLNDRATAISRRRSTYLGANARLHALAGRRSKALELLGKFETQREATGRAGGARGPALVYAALGDKDRAFAALHRDLDQRQLMVFIGTEPKYDSLRSDPRWQTVLRRLNLAR